MTERLTDELWRKLKSFLNKKSICLNPECCESQKLYRKTDFGIQERFKKNKWENNLILSVEPRTLRKLMRKIWKNEEMFLRYYCPVLNLSSEKYPTDMFFMQNVVVVPNTYRLPNLVNGRYYMHTRTKIYSGILREISKLNITLAKEPTLEEMEVDEEEKMENSDINFAKRRKQSNVSYAKERMFAFGRVQVEIDKLFDAEKKSFGLVGGKIQQWSDQKDKPIDGGIKQSLEHKTGKIRAQMMGKRANYSGRSVITPDPYIDVDEIGVSLRYARELTVPVKVNHMNRLRLRNLIMNGPDTYPGANFIETHQGQLRRIASKTDFEYYAKRLKMADIIGNEIENGEPLKTIIVHRHLLKGDYLLVNRQPTLHKSSLLSFRAYIYLDESLTIRLNYAACKGFNADFDGDEINIHCPQNADARSEMRSLCAFHMNYLSPRDGKPIAGLIQDHVLAAVDLTRDDHFFSFEHYRELVNSAFRRITPYSMRYQKPAIILPKKLWTGKQVFSTVLRNILMSDGDSNRKFFSFESKSAMSYSAPIGPFDEKYVCIANCELLVGIIDSKNIGSSMAGLIHRIQFLYGNKVWVQVLSGFSRMLSHYCKLVPFSLSAKNVLLTEKAAKKRTSKLNQLENIGQKIALEALGIPDDKSVDQNQIRNLLEEQFIRNPKFQEKFDKVSKEHTRKLMNSFMNIISKSGSLESDSTRNQLRTMIMSGAKGKPENLLQMTMAVGQIEFEGKRPPFNLMGRTLPCFHPYDPNPKASGFVSNSYCNELDQAEFHFVATAGREGLVDTAVKTSRSGYLQRSMIKGLENLRVNYDGTVRDCDGTIIQFQYGEDGLDCTKTEFLKYEHFDWLIKHMNTLLPKYYHPDKVVSIPNLDQTVHRYWKKLKKNKPTNDKMSTLFHDYSPRTYFGSCSDKMLQQIERKVSELKKMKNKSDDNVVEKFRNLIYSLLATSQVPPGDAVGITTAQSLGEPSTQMTLNTFHMAGNSNQNVTLGIPQLIELLQRGSRCRKNAYMEVCFRENLNDFDTVSQNLILDFQKVKLSDILKKDGHIKYQMSVTNPEDLFFITVRMNVLSEVYSKVKPKELMNIIVKSYLKKLEACLRNTKEKKPNGRSRKRKRKVDDDDDDDDDVGGGGGGYDSDDEEHEIGHRNFKKNAKSNKIDLSDDNLFDDMASEDEIDENDENENSDHQQIKTENYNSDNSDGDVDESENDDDLDPDYDNEEEEEEEEEEESETEEKMIDDKKNIKRKSKMKQSSYSSKELYDFVQNEFELVKSFEFDKKEYKWLMFKMELPMDGKYGELDKVINSVAESIVINEVPGIIKADIYNNAEGGYVFRTEGVNFESIVKYKHLFELKTFYSNDVHTMLTHFGIDAARACLIREIRTVYEAYNIKIDYRHYSLVADYLLNSGRYHGFNRFGIKYCASPFQRITNETAVNNLIECIVQDKYETSNGVSACVLTANKIKMGNGYCKLLTDNKLYEKLLINRLYENKPEIIYEYTGNCEMRERTFEDDREEFMKSLFFGSDDPLDLL